MIEGIFTAIGSLSKSNIRNDDDLIDRLNHRLTVLFLVVFTVVVSTTQYVGNPIHCWCPAYFTTNHEEFADRICWISNTYYLPSPEAIPGQPGNVKQHIGYYQWVPLVLLFQAFFFYLPCLLWRILNDRSGINVNNLVEAAETIQNALYPERREKTIKYMIRHLDHYLDYQREYRGGCCSCLKSFAAKYLCMALGNRYGNYLISLYMITKILYVANVIAQLFLLTGFLGTDYHLYGYKVIRSLIAGEMRDISRQFPTVTLCDFDIRHMGNVHRHTVQCVLSINMFNEKIYIFIWFWFVFLATANCFSFLRWLWVVCFRTRRIRYVRKHLKIMGKLNRESERDRKLSYQFSEMYLRQDGVFVLKLVAKNSTDLVVADILAALWDNYRNNKPLNASSRVIGTEEEPLEETLEIT